MAVAQLVLVRRSSRAQCNDRLLHVSPATLAVRLSVYRAHSVELDLVRDVFYGSGASLVELDLLVYGILRSSRYSRVARHPIRARGFGFIVRACAARAYLHLGSRTLS